MPTLPPPSAAIRRRSSSPYVVRRNPRAGSAACWGQEDPGQGDVLVLADVGEVVVRRKLVHARPLDGLGEPTLRHEQTCAHRRNRLHVRGEVAVVHPLGVDEQCDRAGQIPLQRVEPGACDAPAVREPRQTRVVPQPLGSAQQLGGRLQIVALEGDLAQAHEHVRRPPHHPGRLLGGDA